MVVHWKWEAPQECERVSPDVELERQDRRAGRTPQQPEKLRASLRGWELSCVQKEIAGCQL